MKRLTCYCCLIAFTLISLVSCHGGNGQPSSKVVVDSQQQPKKADTNPLLGKIKVADSANKITDSIESAAVMREYKKTHHHEGTLGLLDSLSRLDDSLKKIAKHKHHQQASE